MSSYQKFFMVLITRSRSFMLPVFAVSILLNAHAQENTFAKVFYDNNGAAQAYTIIKTSDNNYMVAGVKDGAGLLIKMDPSGNFLMQKKYESTGENRFNTVIETRDSGFVMAGFHKDNSGSFQYVFVVKVSSEGDTLWSKTINNGFWCYGMSVQETFDNGFIVTGYTYQTPGPSTIIIVDKLDQNGNLSWSKTITCGNHHNFGYPIRQTPDSGYIIGGCYDTYSQEDSQALIIKLTPAGNVSWAYQIAGFSYSCISDIIIESDGILLFILSADGVVFMKTDFSGNILWSKWNSFGAIVGGGDLPSPRLYKTLDHGFAYFDGMMNLVRTDSAGNYLWSQNLFFYPADVIETADKGFIGLGNGPIWGVEMTETLNPQIGIIKMDSLGTSIACVWGSDGYSDTLTGVLAPMSVTITDAGMQSNLPLLISDAGLSADSGCVEFTGSIKETSKVQPSILVFPNPSGGKFQIRTEPRIEKEIKSVQIYNGIGQCIYRSDDSSVLNSPIEITNNPDGIYYVRVVSGDKILSQKFTISH